MKDRKILELILGIVLLIPSLISVLLFLKDFILTGSATANIWIGLVERISKTDNLPHLMETSSPLPIYFGLTGIAGAILINKSYKK